MMFERLMKSFSMALAAGLLAVPLAAQGDTSIEDVMENVWAYSCMTDKGPELFTFLSVEPTRSILLGAPGSVEIKGHRGATSVRHNEDYVLFLRDENRAVGVESGRTFEWSCALLNDQLQMIFLELMGQIENGPSDERTTSFAEEMANLKGEIEYIESLLEKANRDAEQAKFDLEIADERATKLSDCVKYSQGAIYSAVTSLRSGEPNETVQRDLLEIRDRNMKSCFPF